MKTTTATIPPDRDAMATQLVESLSGEMDYLGWFTAIARAYPDNPHDWRTAMETAWRVQQALLLAETLLRADHTTGSQITTGAQEQVAA